MPRVRHLAWNSSDAAVRAIENAEQDDAAADSDSPPDSDAQDAAVDTNADVFHECLAELVIQRLAHQRALTERHQAKSKSKGKGNGEPSTAEPDGGISAPTDDDAAALESFLEYLSDELFPALPPALRDISHAALAASPKLAEQYDDPLPASTVAALAAPLPATLHADLSACGALPADAAHPQADLHDFLAALVTTYISRAAAPPPPPAAPDAAGPRPAACELCARDWVPLTVHHLVPRAAWSKALKRGWIASEADAHRRLAFLCRACHSCVHRSASNLELARSLNTVEALAERADVASFVRWVRRVRWRKR